MSSKITNKIVFSEFACSITKLINDQCAGDKYLFGDSIETAYDTVRRWCKGEYLPDGIHLLMIHEKYKVSIDWLLTGKAKHNDDSMDCETKCGEKISQLCKKVKEVVESETHWGASLEANIHSFQAGLDGDKEREEIKKDMRELKKHNAGLSSATPQKDIGSRKVM